MRSLANLGNELYTGERSFNIVGNRKRWFAIAIVGVVLSALVFFVKGINPGIEFRGGTEFTVSGTKTLSGDPAVEILKKAGVKEVRTSTVGQSSMRIQTIALESQRVETLRADLAKAYDVPATQITSAFVGPAWGAGVTTKALQGLLIFLVLVSITMAIYFRSVLMAAAAVIALIHDLIVTVGIYALVGFEVTPASVIGFLTILGYSLYDTVVVFDKIRENTQGIYEQSRYTHAEAANLAVNQMLVRSLNTTIVGVLPVAAILFVGTFLLGAGTLGDIALALFIGMIISTISSLLLATPLEVVLRNREEKVAAHNGRVLERRGSDEGSGAEAVVAHTTMRAGGHLGQSAQPRRKRRSSR